MLTSISEMRGKMVDCFMRIDKRANKKGGGRWPPPFGHLFL